MLESIYRVHVWMENLCIVVQKYLFDSSSASTLFLICSQFSTKFQALVLLKLFGVLNSRITSAFLYNPELLKYYSYILWTMSFSLLWQMSSKVEVLASCSLIRRLKFHLCVVMLLDSRLSRNHSEISKNCSLEHSIYNFVQLFGAMPLTSSVHASVTNSVELENEDSNE